MKQYQFILFFLLNVIIGLSILLYPIFTTYWNQQIQSHVIETYESAVGDMGKETYTTLLKNAHQYNTQLWEIPRPFLNGKEIPGYENLLNVDESGVIGYITIEKIHINVPIYHGTSSGIPGTAIDHQEGSSLPIGEKNAHVVLSFHQGFPPMKRCSDLGQMAVGDVFTITVLGQVLTYQVDQVQVVESNPLPSFKILPGQDLCTLTSCTSYGSDTCYFMVRGTRISAPYLSAFQSTWTKDLHHTFVIGSGFLILMTAALIQYKKEI